MSTKTDYPSQGVAYVKAIGDPELQGKMATAEILIKARAIITLVWHEQVGMWKVYGIGEAILPEEIPPTS